MCSGGCSTGTRTSTRLPTIHSFLVRLTQSHWFVIDNLQPSLEAKVRRIQGRSMYLSCTIAGPVPKSPTTASHAISVDVFHSNAWKQSQGIN